MGHPKNVKNGILKSQKQTEVSDLRQKLTEMSKNRPKRVRWSEIDRKLTKRQKSDLPKNGQKQDSDPKKLTKMSEIGQKLTKMSEIGPKQTKWSKNRPSHIFRIMSLGENKLYHSDGDEGEDYIEENQLYIDIGNDTEEDLDIALREMLENAKQEGLSENGSRVLEKLLKDYRSVFRIRLGYTTGLISIFLFFGVPKMAGPLASATPKDFETQMGENFSKQINLIFRPCKGSPTATTRLQPYLDKMAEEGEVGFPIVFTFVNVSAPNAFALPGGHVMATRGLLEAVGDDHEAFMAVMAHELGHVKSRDGLQAFYRNMGLGLVLEVITGGTGVAQQAVAITAQLNQLHHTRLQEARADDTAFAIMDKLNMDPAALSRAFKAIVAKSSADDSDETTPKADINKRKKRSIPGWLRSHPATDGRIERAQQRANDQAADFISNQDWQVIKSACL